MSWEIKFEQYDLGGTFFIESDLKPDGIIIFKTFTEAKTVAIHAAVDEARRWQEEANRLRKLTKAEAPND